MVFGRYVLLCFRLLDVTIRSLGEYCCDNMLYPVLVGPLNHVESNID